MTVRPYHNYRCVGYDVIYTLYSNFIFIYTYFVARLQSLHFLGYKSVVEDKHLLEPKRGEFEGKRLLGRPRRRRKDNMKVGLSIIY